jgi:hypothetical protein
LPIPSTDIGGASAIARTSGKIGENYGAITLRFIRTCGNCVAISEHIGGGKSHRIGESCGGIGGNCGAIQEITDAIGARRGGPGTHAIGLTVNWSFT